MKSEAILIATVAVIATKSTRFSRLLSRNGQDPRSVESSAKLAFVINHYMHGKRNANKTRLGVPGICKSMALTIEFSMMPRKKPLLTTPATIGSSRATFAELATATFLEKYRDQETATEFQCSARSISGFKERNRSSSRRAHLNRHVNVTEDGQITWAMTLSQLLSNVPDHARIINVDESC
jgi:hypothetical protein